MNPFLLIGIGLFLIVIFFWARLNHRPRHYRELLSKWPLQNERLCSHRGYGKRGRIAENTLAAFLAAMKEGYLLHEMDVRISKDGEVILFHGPLLQTTTSGKGRLEHHTMDYLANLNWGAYLVDAPPVPITPLATYLDGPGRQNLTNIELKRDFLDLSRGLEKETARLVQTFDLVDRVFFSSFHLLSLMRLRQLIPECGRGLLLEPGRFFSLRLWLGILLSQPDFIHLPREAGTPKRISQLRKRGYGLLIWTVNEVDEASRLLRYGADIICTDNIAMINSLPGR